jgi:uncharacterized protein YecE (DUF72 family)
VTVYLGASGWQYRSWRGPYYPPGLAQARWLEFYAEDFATVEVNNTFYRLPPRSTFERWFGRTPGDFTVTVKASRYLTHIKRLRDPEEPVKRLMTAAAGLEHKLGPVLVQLPPDLPIRLEELDRTLSCFPAGVRVAVEPRHPTWWTDETEAVLRQHNAVLAWADRMSQPVTPLWRTADWAYLRFHEGRGAQHPGYTTRDLRRWGERISELFPPAGEAGTEADIFVYFNNDPRGCAIHDLPRFGRLLAQRGYRTTRFPSRSIQPSPRDLDLPRSA